MINAKAEFINGPKIKIEDTRCVNYLVQLLYFYKGEWIVSYEGPNVESGFSFGSYITNRHKWKWLVYGYENEQIKLLFQKTYDEKGKKIMLEFETDSSELEKVYFAKIDNYNIELNRKELEENASRIVVSNLYTYYIFKDWVVRLDSSNRKTIFKTN